MSQLYRGIDDAESLILEMDVAADRDRIRFLPQAGGGPSTGGCVMRWSYRYLPRHWWTSPLVWLISHTVWRAYMRRSIRRCAAAICD